MLAKVTSLSREFISSEIGNYSSIIKFTCWKVPFRKKVTFYFQKTKVLVNSATRVQLKFSPT